MVNNDTLFNKLGLNNYYCIDLNYSAYSLGGFWDSTDSLFFYSKPFICVQIVIGPQIVLIFLV